MNRREFFGRVVGIASASLAFAARVARPVPFVLPPGTYVIDRPIELGDDARLLNCDITFVGNGHIEIVGQRVIIRGCSFQR